MNKILFLHVSTILGGSERSFLDLLEQATLDQKKLFTVVLPGPGPLNDELQKFMPEVKIVTIPLPQAFAKITRKWPVLSLFVAILTMPALIVYLYRLVTLIKKLNPRIIYSNGLKCHILSLVLKKISPRPTVWHLQDFFPELWYLKKFLNWVGTAPELIVCNSDSVQENLKLQIPGQWKTRLTTVHNAVDAHHFTPQSKNYANDTVVISMVGMLTPWKGQDIFIEAIIELLNANANLKIHCQIVGDETYQTFGESGFKKRLIERVFNSGLKDKIIFLGLIKEIEKIYQQSDIVVHCSIRPEPFGRVIIEAMASECAVVAAAAGGVTEIITDQVDGLLVQPGVVSDLRLAIEKLCTDSSLRMKLSKAGRKTVEKKFSSTSFAEKIFSDLQFWNQV